jgi:glutaredoxin
MTPEQAMIFDNAPSTPTPPSCSYCKWDNTNLWRITVGEESKRICQTCVQMMANTFAQSPAYLVGKTSELERRLKAVEVMLLP